MPRMFTKPRGGDDGAAQRQTTVAAVVGQQS